ncbi:hypothetical protein ACS0TY_009892 [Phlomoides rotata]
MAEVLRNPKTMNRAKAELKQIIRKRESSRRSQYLPPPLSPMLGERDVENPLTRACPHLASRVRHRCCRLHHAKQLTGLRKCLGHRLRPPHLGDPDRFQARIIPRI